MQHNQVLRVWFYLLAAILAVLFFAFQAHAGPTTNAPSVILAWDRSPDASVTGYAVYYGIASRNYTNRIQVNGATVTTCQVTNLVRGLKYYFAATAFTPSLESGYSSEVTWDTTPLPPVPANVTISQQNP